VEVCGSEVTKGSFQGGKGRASNSEGRLGCKKPYSSGGGEEPILPK